MLSEEVINNKVVNLPPSKSIANRLLVLSYLFNNKSICYIEEPLPDDVSLMRQLLTEQLPTVCNCDNAGTVLRFLSAVAAIDKKKCTMTGCERMKQRPVSGLTDALKILGTEIEFLREKGKPPFRINKTININSNKIPQSIYIDGRKSSQFVSAIMMIAPKLKNGLTIKFDKNIGSYSYIKMTSEIMNTLGLTNSLYNDLVSVAPYSKTLNLKKYKKVEADWSAAAFFYPLVCAFPEKKIILKNLSLNSIQGDKKIASIMKEYGIETFQDKENIIISKNSNQFMQDNKKCLYIDVKDTPDLAPVIAVVAALSAQTTVITGIQNLIHKESDRAELITKNLNKLGYSVTYNKTVAQIIIDNKKQNIPSNTDIIIETESDHRIAMAFAIFEKLNNKLSIIDRHCVSKSFPTFWDYF